MPGGCRSLTDDEIIRALPAFTGPCELRDRAFFVVGLTTGLRVSELLSLRRAHVIKAGRFADEIRLAAKQTKGGQDAAVLPLTGFARTHLRPELAQLAEQGYRTRGCYLFQSQSLGNKPISRTSAWRVLQRMFERAGIYGKLGTHCMRKTFSRKLYEATGKDPAATRLGTRHRDPESLVHYMENDRLHVAELVRRLYGGLA